MKRFSTELEIQQKEIISLEASHKKSQEQANKESAKRENRVKKRLERVQEELKEATTSSEYLKQSLIEAKTDNDALSKKAAKLASEMDTMKIFYKDNIQNMESKKNKELAESKSAHQKEIENLMKVHMSEVKELQGQFNRVQELFDKKYSRLEKKMNEMQDLYETRPSRKEDLEEIKKLHEESMSKDNMMKKLEGDAKFYRLELINREENYNKVFGASPVVGIFNPLEKSDSLKNLRENASPKQGKKRKQP